MAQKIFITLLITLSILTILTSPPLVRPFLHHEPTSTPTPVTPTPTSTPTVTPDPFAAIPTATSRANGIVVEVQSLPSPALGELPPSATPASVTWDIPQPAATHSIDTPLAGWPVGGDISQHFGCSPYFSGISGPNCPAEQPWFHDGLDLAAWPGAPVRAGLSGTVSFAGSDGNGPPCGVYRGYGLGVVVDNGAGWQALYAHLAEINVSAGQAVRADTVIGTVGETGCGTGPHLHFGLRYEGELVDPALFKP